MGPVNVSTLFIVSSTADSTTACGIVVVCCGIGWTLEDSALSAKEVGRPEKEMVNSIEVCPFDEQQVCSRFKACPNQNVEGTAK